jgi:hypothetical protein
MLVDVLNQDGQDYFLFTFLVSMGDDVRYLLADLQNIEKLYPDVYASDLRIFDVDSEPYWEDTKVRILVPKDLKNIATMVKTLNQIEERQKIKRN